MAEDSFKEDKTESATPKKREKARDEGQTVQSKEVNTVIMLLLASLIIYALGGYILNRFYLLFQFSFLKAAVFRIDPENLHGVATQVIIQAFTVLGPMMFFLLLIAL